MWENREALGAWWPSEWGDAPAWVSSVVGDVIVASTVPSDRWRGVGASRRGRLHAHRGEAREDALLIVQAGPLLIAAVADGAGSRPLSRIGAAVACRAAVATLAQRSGDVRDAAALRTALGEALVNAESALCTLATTHDIDAKDLRTTLLLGAVAHTTDGTLIGGAQIGDGVIAVEDGTGAVRALVSGDGGEFADEVSHFLPDGGAAERAVQRIVVEAAGTTRVLFVCSDGVDDCFYPITTMGPALIAQLREGVSVPLDGFTQAPSTSVLAADDPAASLAEWLRFEKRGENDDRTLAVLWRDAP